MYLKPLSVIVTRVCDGLRSVDVRTALKVMLAMSGAITHWADARLVLG